MKDVARLEAQLESVDVKPRSKLSQRPKDTVARDQTHSLSNIHAGRVKTVEKSKLKETCMLLKLKLQTAKLSQDQIGNLLYGSEMVSDMNHQISISDLRAIFENLGISGQKSMLIARYLIEPPSNGDVILNENAKSTKGEIARELKELIGHYRLYQTDGQVIDDDENYVYEDYMKKVVMETFGRYKETLI